MKINSKFIIAAIFGLALLAYFALDLQQYLSLDSLKQHQASLSQWVQSHYVQALFGFFILYVAATSLSLPGATILTLLAGAIFGLGTGFVLVSFASSIGATLAMLVSRHLLRDTVQNKLGDKLNAIENGIEKDGAFYLLSLRLVPIVPFFAINMLFGLTQFRAKTFYWVSQLGMLPGTLVYVNAGTALSQLDSVADVASPSLFLSLAALAALPWVGRWINSKIQARKIYQGYDKPKHFDQNMVVIGAGAGGLVSAYIAAAVKAKVMLIEKHQMGGDCLNTGCVPSKALLAAAHSVRKARHASQLGVEFAPPTIDFAAVMAHVKSSITAIEPNDSPERYRSLGVDVELGEGKVIDPWRVEVNGKVVTTQSIVLATGGRPRMPNIEGIDQQHVYNSDTIWSLTQQPEHLVVYGGGPIGCELAQAFCLLGSRVTMIVQSEQVLGREEPEAAESIAQALRSDGVDIHLQSTISQIDSNRVTLENGDTLTADAVLIAIGRESIAPKNMGLEALGILDERGVIGSNEKLQTAIPNIFVVGDATGGPQFTHAASHMAWHAAVNGLFGQFKQFAVDYSAMPMVTYTHPEVARVGLTESEARANGIEYEVSEHRMSHVDRAITETQAPNGWIKLITAKSSDKVLGVTLVDDQAGELIQEWVFAKRHKLGVNKVLATIHAYPTRSEINKYVAGNWKKAHAPQQALKWLAKWFAWRRG